jgi:hypothetical protein
MTNIKDMLPLVPLILLIPLLVKLKMLLLGQIRPDEFFKKGVFCSIKVENIITCLGIIVILIFLFLDWYKTPELR